MFFLECMYRTSLLAFSPGLLNAAASWHKIMDSECGWKQCVLETLTEIEVHNIGMHWRTYSHVMRIVNEQL